MSLRTIPYGALGGGRKRFSAQSGPWTGVNDAEDPGEARLSTAFDATDCVFADPAHGSGAKSRTGIRGAYWKLSGAAAALDKVGKPEHGETFRKLAK